jgi:hypothetical protein
MAEVRNIGSRYAEKRVVSGPSALVTPMTRWIIDTYKECERFDISLKEVMDTWIATNGDAEPVSLNNVVDAISGACTVHALYWEKCDRRITGFSTFDTVVLQEKSPKLPPPTDDEYFVVKVIANVDITALADYRDMLLKSCSDEELSGLLFYRRICAHKFAVVAYPRQGFDTKNNRWYPQSDQQSRIVFVVE